MKNFQLKIRISIFVIIVVSIIFCFNGCSTNPDENSQFNENATVGILHTTSEESRIVWYDDNLNKLNESRYAFSAAVWDGFRNMCEDENKVYMFPKGSYEKCDYEKLVSIDLTTGMLEETDVNRENTTSYDLKNRKIVFASNNNGEYVDVIDLDTGEQKGMTLKKAVTDQVVWVDDRIFATCYNDDSTCCLYEFDIENDSEKKLLDFPDDDLSPFLVVKEKYIGLISENKLVKYNVETGNTSHIKLSRKNAYNMNLKGDILWIAYTDVFQEETPETVSYIEARDFETGDVLAEQEVKGAVFQMEFVRDDFYVLTDKHLSRYEYKNNELKIDKRISIDIENEDTGALFIR